MKIQFENQAQLNAERITISQSNTHTINNGKEGIFIADISSTVMDNNAYGVQGRTTEEVMQEASLTDVKMQRNYMTVMSNSMSTEDFSEMLKEGVNPNDMDLETTVTIVDRIKAELVKSGVHVKGYTDDLDRETMAKIVGSESLAAELTKSFRENDIPVTKENFKSAVAAVEKALELQRPTEGETKYMVHNTMEPTIENLYKSQHSGALDANRQGRGYYQEGYGYYAKKADLPDFQKLESQIKDIIKEAGLEDTKEVLKEAEWLVEKGIPLTKESISSFHEMTNLKLPLKESQAVEIVTAAMLNGQKPIQADVKETSSKYVKAKEMSEYVDGVLKDPTISISLRKQLEEARICMSAEVNLRMVEKGISIDLQEMEYVLGELRKAEQEQAEKMFPDTTDVNARQNLQLYRETLEKTSVLPGLPAAVLGKVAFHSALPSTINGYVDLGKEIQINFEKANQAYETLMTAPRKDLGDRIQKAFQNVDEILVDLDFELSFENQRAVRILSYNQIEITKENIEKIRKEDRRLTRVIGKMTPSSVLQMIRDGVNPLQTKMEDLERYFDSLNENPEKQMETYSRYLHRLEKTKEITPEEREAYIGVYRLLRQIEKTDGAVIGSVLKANSPLDFRQLLTAARTAKKVGMNLLVDECFGGISALETENEKIDEQISKIDQECLQEEYLDAEKEIKNARQMDQEKNVVEFLERLDLPVSIHRILAASSFMENGNSLFKSLKEEKKEEKKDLLTSLTDSLLKSMTDKESVQEEYDTFSQEIINHLHNKMVSVENTSLDIKALKNSFLQIQIAKRLSKEETYEIPVTFGGELVAVRLKVQHNQKEKGQVEVSFESEKSGKVKIDVNIQNENVEVYVTGENKQPEELENLQNLLKDKLKNQKNATSRALYNVSKTIIQMLMDAQ